MSSEITSRSRSTTTRASASICAAPYTAPVGFDGLFSTTARVFAVTAAATCAADTAKSSAARVGTITGRPAASITMSG